MQQEEKIIKIPGNLARSFNSLRKALIDVYPDPFPSSRNQSDTRSSADTPSEDGPLTQTVSNQKTGDLNLEEIKAIKIYLEKTIAAYQFRSFPGFGTDNRSLYLETEKLFTPPLFTDKRMGLIRPEKDDGPYSGASPLSMTSILQRYKKFLLVGQAGSGKTIFLLYQVLSHAQNMLDLLTLEKQTDSGQAAPGSSSVKPVKNSRVEILLPVYISLREFGNFLKDNPGSSITDNPALLWKYIFSLPDCSSETLFSKPGKYFDTFFCTGKAILLLDGLDEVPETQVRSRILQIIQKFSNKYSACRYIITTRPQSAPGMITPISKFGTLEINPVSKTEAIKFVRTLLVNRALVNEAASDQIPAENPAVLTEKFTKALNNFPGIWNTTSTYSSVVVLLNLVITGRDIREKFSENLDDLISQLIISINISTTPLDKNKTNAPDTVRLRKMICGIAFWCHQNYLYDYSLLDISSIFTKLFRDDPDFDGMSADDGLLAFKNYLDQQTGLFIYKPGQKIKFVWRSIQEFLAAEYLVQKSDSTAFSRKCVSSAWWYPVLKFETYFLRKLPPFRLSEFLEIFLSPDQVPGMDDAAKLNLGFDCVSDLLPDGLKSELSVELVAGFRKMQVLPQQAVQAKDYFNKVRANNSLPLLPTWQSAPRFWSEPFGEPEWVEIPAGPFWMGEAGKSNNFLHQVWLPTFHISRIPVTNAQYALFIADTARDVPVHWYSNHVPAGLENHPVVNISWHDAVKYCGWLSAKTGLQVSLPSEAEWEKSARGVTDRRDYPWGSWLNLHANTSEFKLSHTTPVDLFPNGASPFGCLDMSGNVREWTRSLADFDYPYDHNDPRREDINAAEDKPRVLRGGSYYYHKNNARVTSRQRFLPDFKFSNFGFRIVKLSENAGN